MTSCHGASPVGRLECVRFMTVSRIVKHSAGTLWYPEIVKV